MKSNKDPQSINFQLLQKRLLDVVINKVNNGAFTERGLARVIGVSQPQIHNVLKGKRKLQPALADRILERFGIDILDLVSEDETRRRLVAGLSQPTETDPAPPSRKKPSSQLKGERTIDDIAV